MQVLSLENCALGKGAFPGVAEAFSPLLVHLNVAHNAIGEQGGQELAEQLALRCRSLRSLDVHGNDLTASGLAHLCSQLAGRCMRLEELHIGSNGVEAAIVRNGGGGDSASELLGGALALLAPQLTRLCFGKLDATGYLEVCPPAGATLCFQARAFSRGTFLLGHKGTSTGLARCYVHQHLQGAQGWAGPRCRT